MTTENWLQEHLARDPAMTIRQALREGPKRKIELRRATHLSRPTIDKYLRTLQTRHEVDREGMVFHLSDKGLAELETVEHVTRLAQRPPPTDRMQRVDRSDAGITFPVGGGGSRVFRDVEALSGQKLLACYVCGKCSAGCPLAALMDIPPHQVIRLLQLGQDEEVLHARTPWLCSSCFTCATRCPRGINLAAVMEALRALALRKGVDHVSPSHLSASLRSAAPQLALVSCFRKLSA
jgi:heterodisulfide reductase subunit C